MQICFTTNRQQQAKRAAREARDPSTKTHHEESLRIISNRPNMTVMRRVMSVLIQN